MQEMVRGFRTKLSDHLDVSRPFRAEIETEGTGSYSGCCIGTDAAEHLTDTRFVVFNDQKRMPNGEITYVIDGKAAVFDISLGALPAQIEKLIFAVSIDGAGTMGQVLRHTVRIIQDGKILLTMELSGRDFHNEKAIVDFEIYKKGVWRIAVVANGYDGGLAELLRHYGGDLMALRRSVAQNPPPAPAKSAAMPSAPAPAASAAQQGRPWYEQQSTPTPPATKAPSVPPAPAAAPKPETQESEDVPWYARLSTPSPAPARPAAPTPAPARPATPPPAPARPATPPPAPARPAAPTPAPARPAAPPAVPPPVSAAPSAPANSWTCSCGTVNQGKFCSDCGKSKPAPASQDSWTCSCGTVNQGKFCSECGSPKPSAASSDTWTCSCGTTNRGKFCAKCGNPKGAAASQPKPATAPAAAIPPAPAPAAPKAPTPPAPAAPKASAAPKFDYKDVNSAPATPPKPAQPASSAGVPPFGQSAQRSTPPVFGQGPAQTARTSTPPVFGQNAPAPAASNPPPFGQAPAQNPQRSAPVNPFQPAQGSSPSMAPLPPVTKAPSAPPAPAAPAKVELRKGERVNLTKQGATMGEILVNLNWSQPSGLFGSGAIDLDLECLYELTNGKKFGVQALGGNFGSLTSPPYIQLDGDDRSGSSTDGENIRINGAKLSEIKRILIFTSIYEGAVNWKQAKGIVTIKCPGNPELIVRMDSYHSKHRICAIAMLENRGDGSLSVEKIVEYYDSKPQMDQAYHWGLSWKHGSK